MNVEFSIFMPRSRILAGSRYHPQLNVTEDSDVMVKRLKTLVRPLADYNNVIRGPLIHLTIKKLKEYNIKLPR